MDSKADDYSNLNDDRAEDQITGGHQMQESEPSEQPDRSEIIAFDSSTGQYALRSAGVISYVDVGEMFEMLNNSKVIYVEGAGAIPKITLWYGENDTVFKLVCDEVWVEQITVSDFNSKFSFAVTFLSRYLH